MINYSRCRGQAAKLQPKFVGPYAVVEVMPNHTDKIEHSGQVSIQNEARLKPYWVSPDAVEKAPRCWSPHGRQQCVGDSNVDQSMKWAEDLARDGRPLPLTEVCLPFPTPDLTPSLLEPGAGPEVQTPPGGGAPSGEIREKQNEETPVINRPVTPPVELNSPPVSTPPSLQTDIAKGRRILNLLKSKPAD